MLSGQTWLRHLRQTGREQQPPNSQAGDGAFPLLPVLGFDVALLFLPVPVPPVLPVPPVSPGSCG